MIGWIIISVSILILAVLLLSSVKISLKIDENIVFSVSYLGFSFFTFDSSKKDKNPKLKSTSSNKSKKCSAKGSFVSFLKKYAESIKKTELIKELFDILKLVLLRFKKLLSKVWFADFLLDLSVGSEDAAQTAILYGRFCTVIYPILSMLSACRGFSVDNTSIKTDFISEDISLKLSSVIKVRISSLLLFAVGTAYSIVRLKIGELKNA